MKKYALSVVALALAVSFYLSQQPANTESEPRFESASGPYASRATAFAVSRPLREMASEQDSGPVAAPRDLRVRNIGAGNDLFGTTGFRQDADGSMAQLGTTPMPPPTVSVPGIANLDNGMIYQLLFLPADMNGDVGPNHYVQIVNSLFRVYDKNGEPMSSLLKISSLFESLGTVCATRNDGLAVVLYDPLADRWLISQTCTAFPPFRQMVAISKTGDPMGQIGRAHV